MSETPGFRLLTLGTLRLLAPDGRDEPTLASRPRKLALLALLAITRRPMTRDRLVSLFWGEQDEDRARHSLSDALSSLRRALGRGAITSRQQQVGLDESVALSVDLRALADAASARDWRRVVSLHQAPFLEGVHVAGSAAWDQWVTTQRDGAARLFQTACRHESERMAADAQWSRLVPLTTRWIEQWPEDPTAACWHLTALARDEPSDPAAPQLIRDAYDHLTQRLDAEFGTVPDPDVRERRDAMLDELRSVRRTNTRAADATLLERHVPEDADPVPTVGENAVEMAAEDVTVSRPEAPRARASGALVALLALPLLALAGINFRPVAATPVEPFTLTTNSPEAEALVKQALLGSAGDVTRTEALHLLDRARALDSGFAMAHRTRALLLEEDGTHHAEVTAALSRAAEASARVTPFERALILSSYHMLAAGDYARAAAAQRELLRLAPDDGDAWHDLGMMYQYVGDDARAADAYRAALRHDATSASTWANLVDAVHASSDRATTAAVLDSMTRAIPGHLSVFSASARVHAAEGDWARAEQQARSYLTAAPDVPRTQGIGEMLLSRILWSAGRLDEGDAAARRGIEWWALRGDTVMALRESLALASATVWTRHDPEAARRLADRAVTRFAMERTAPEDRPLLELATVQALVGDPDTAGRTLREYERATPPDMRRRTKGSEALARGSIAFAAGRLAEAAREFRSAATADCQACGLPELGLVLESLDDSAGARAAYDRFLSLRSLRRTDLSDALHRGWVSARLAGGAPSWSPAARR